MILIGLCVYAGWSETLLVAHTILLELSRGGLSQRTTNLPWDLYNQKMLRSDYIHPVWQGFSFIPLLINLRFYKEHAISEDFDQTDQMCTLIRVFASRTSHSVGFVVRWLIFHILWTHSDYFLARIPFKPVLVGWVWEWEWEGHVQSRKLQSCIWRD